MFSRVHKAASQQKEEVNALIESKDLYQDDPDTKRYTGIATEVELHTELAWYDQIAFLEG